MTATERNTLRALATPPLPPDEWVEEHIRIPVRGNPEPGRYRFDRTPYWREPTIECARASSKTHIVIMKTPQTGASQWSRGVIGYWTDTSADPILLVYPNQDACEEQLDERLVPTIRESPRLSRWLTHRARDVTLDTVTLAHATIYGAWASSPQALASRPVPKVVLDETDKYLGSSKEADPEELAEHRTTAYPTRKKILAISTPTTKDGTIWRMHRRCRDRRRWHVACPCCGELVLLEWSAFRWDKQAEVDPTDEDQATELADALEVGDARAWVVCPSCDGEITEAQRLPAVLAGEWQSEGYPPGERPRSKRVAYHVPAWLSPWVTFADVVVAYLKSQSTDDPRDFHNGFLALPSEQLTGTIAADVFTERSDARPYEIPAWATAVVGGADTQARDGRPFWRYVVRAFGKANKSQLVAKGKANTWQGLRELTVDARFVVEGLKTTSGADLLMVDSGGGVETEDGNTTHLVYEGARLDPGRIVPIKGASKRQDRLIRASVVEYLRPGSKQKANAHLHTLDVERLKDMLAALIRSAEPPLWFENSLVDPEYIAQMCAQEKVRVRVGRKFEWHWMRTGRARDDYFDATVYALAGAVMMRASDRAERSERRKRAQPTNQNRAQREPDDRRMKIRGSNRKSGRSGDGWIRRR